MLSLHASCLSEGHGTSLAVAAWDVLCGATCVGRVRQVPVLCADSRRFVGEELLSRRTVLCLRYLGVLTNHCQHPFLCKLRVLVSVVADGCPGNVRNRQKSAL